ncbi:MAG: thioredoxin domain-containing protein [Candidatus Methanoperedens sp.]|nr:thioredoxin domain-containing protein [Candidatus Methanoperedens sp.]MCZ7405897.1 thioredoxin domain-containing protein [Candidatus Methanoperedens sp.]
MENKGVITGKRPNRLINEKSPYLLQHAYNPVDWYPWGKEAFEKAIKEDKPVFLSIGYSTCHWCHVMEKESFEDEQVAGLMNDAFVSIKVDREERPDIDSIYMAACQRMTGSGGWPLNMIITPDKKPFYAATYIPKESKFGRVGMLGMIPQLKDIWKTKRNEVEAAANNSVHALKTAESPGEEPDEEYLHETYEQLLALFDEQHGGFGDAPKFPTPHNLMFLLRYWKRTGDKMALFMVEKTLSAMRMGGIFDHIGFGFHRYSTDAGWLVPHFEKMLYDQALLAMAYTEAYHATGKDEYKKTCREIFTYVLRDMTSKEGGFYSGEDADSEGEEGKFYVWTEEEIRAVLSGDEAELVKKVFNISKDGNFPEGKNTGRNIFHLTKSFSGHASNFKLSVKEVEERIETAQSKLFDAREKRIHPGKDDKILTDWNGLMIAALARGAAVFDDYQYAEAAQKGADFILSKMRNENGRLFHRYRDGEIAVPALLDDYAFLIWGLIELYETTFEIQYLKAALEFNNEPMEHFWDGENGGFYLTADDAENILLRKKDIYDGAVPSGNSVAMLNMVRLGKMTGNPEFEKKATLVGKAFSRSARQSPAAYTMLMTALDFAIGPTAEVVIAGDLHAQDTRVMLSKLRKSFVPGKVVIFRPDGEPEIIHIAEYTRNLKSKDGKATAYVCRNFSCKLPTTDAGEMMRSLDI